MRQYLHTTCSFFPSCFFENTQLINLFTFAPKWIDKNLHLHKVHFGCLLALLALLVCTDAYPIANSRVHFVKRKIRNYLLRSIDYYDNRIELIASLELRACMRLSCTCAPIRAPSDRAMRRGVWLHSTCISYVD